MENEFRIEFFEAIYSPQVIKTPACQNTQVGRRCRLKASGKPSTWLPLGDSKRTLHTTKEEGEGEGEGGGEGEGAGGQEGEVEEQVGVEEGD